MGQEHDFNNCEIDFTKCERNMFRGYDGANGEKISIYYDNKLYMLKFPPKNEEKNIYTTASISEYISCKIASQLDLNVQNVLLGKYNDKIVVACEDFEINGNRLLNFTSVKNSLFHSEKKGRSLNLNNILDTIKEQEYVDSEELKSFFWDMFVLDSLIANGDRHNGNWGILANETEKKCSIAPIYDCGSSFHTHFSEDNMLEVLEDKNIMNNLVTGNPRSAITLNNRGINYYNFLTTTDNKDCLESLKKIHSKIDLAKINKIIDETSYISDIHKEFIKIIVKERKEKILEKALEINKNFKKTKNLENNKKKNKEKER